MQLQKYKEALGDFTWKAFYEIAVSSAYANKYKSLIQKLLNVQQASDNIYSILDVVRDNYFYELCVSLGVCLRKAMVMIAVLCVEHGILDESKLPEYKLLTCYSEQGAFNYLCKLIIEETG